MYLLFRLHYDYYVDHAGQCLFSTVMEPMLLNIVFHPYRPKGTLLLYDKFIYA